MPTVNLPGYMTVKEIAERLDVTASRVRQILQEFRESGDDLGHLVGTVRLFDPADVEKIVRRHTDDRRRTKN